MAKHYYFNIELLPFKGDVGFIGGAGYEELFELLKKFILSSRSEEALHKEAYELRNDFFMTFDSVHKDPQAKSRYVYGKLVKFDSVGFVKRFNTGEVQFQGGEDSVSKMYYFDYVFDCDRHILAVDDASQKLPSVSEMENALVHLLSVISKKFFPDYVLKVFVMKTSASLVDVYENADSFNNVAVDVSFSNSDLMLDAAIKKIEREMRDKGVTALSHQEKSDVKGGMSSPTEQCKAYLGLATKFGNATINYMRRTTEGVKRVLYQMEDFPVSRSIRKGKAEELYREKVLDSIKSVDLDTK